MTTTRFDAIQPPEAASCISPARQRRESRGAHQSPRRGRHETHRACARRDTWRPLRGLKQLSSRLSRRVHAGLIQCAPSGRSKAHARESTGSFSTQMVWLGSTGRSAGTRSSGTLWRLCRPLTLADGVGWRVPRVPRRSAPSSPPGYSLTPAKRALLQSGCVAAVRL
jgi:hypothetical protein